MKILRPRAVRAPLRLAVLALLAAASLDAAAVPADPRHRHGPLGDYDVIHDFDGFAATGGSFPYGALAPSDDGGVYGTTTMVSDAPGPVQRGGLYRIAPSGRVALADVLADRTSAVAAADEGGLLLSYMRDPYISDPDGCGHVVRRTGAKDGRQLHRFSATDPAGCYLQPQLTEGPDGSIYGATEYDGGPADAGTIFRLGVDGVATPLAPLPPYGSDRPDPTMRLCLGDDGDLYVPGDSGLWRITQAGELTKVVTFDAATQGIAPAGGLVRGPDGALYGANGYEGPTGSGTVFRFDPATGAVTVLHAFEVRRPNFDNRPSQSLTLAADGYLYGQTVDGRGNSDGFVFRLRPDGSDYAIVARFVASIDGTLVSGPLLALPDGRLVGTRSRGGANHVGSVFVLTPKAKR